MRITLLLSCLLVGLGFAGAAQTPVPTTLLSGHLDHAPSGDTVRLRVGTHQLKTPLSPAGDFQLAVTGLSQAAFVSFSYARQHSPLYLTLGDQLHLTLDYPQFDECLRFTGRGVAANSYLAQARWQFETGSGPCPQDQWSPTTTPASSAGGGCLSGATACLSHYL